MTTVPNTLTVRSDFPAKTAQEFIAYALANPGGKLNYASQGTGTTSSCRLRSSVMNSGGSRSSRVDIS